MRHSSPFALALLLIPSLAQGEPVVGGVWRSGGVQTEVLMSQTPSDFHQTINDWHGDGKRIVDLETYVGSNGKRLWSGLWRPGNDRARHDLSMSLSELKSAASKHHGDKLRIVDLETYVEGGQRRWAAVWRAGTHRQYFEHAIDASDLQARLDARHADKLRVVDLETYVAGGKRKYAVVWSAGTYRNYVSVGLSAGQMSTLAKERHADGLRLVDLERYMEGGTEKLAGVWRSGSDANWYSTDRYPESFTELDLYQQAKGRRLVDLEVYDDQCGDVYPLPFEDTGKWWISNGNWDDNGGHGGKSTGKQAYAWDLLNDANGDGKSDEGARVLATRAGVVVDLQANEVGNAQAAWKAFEWGSGDPTPSVGNFVVVDHRDGSYGTYWHLQESSVTAKVGDEVMVGQILGRVGNTGNSSAPHLHFDVREDWDVQYPTVFTEYDSIKVRMRDKNHACWRPKQSDALASDNVAKVPMARKVSPMRRKAKTGSKAVAKPRGTAPARPKRGG